MSTNYTEKLKEFIGPAEDGRRDVFDLTPEESIKQIKEGLETAFSVNLWTYEWPNELIAEVDQQLYDEGIVHCWDEVFDSFVCFRTREEMVNFYYKLRVDATEKQLQDLRDHKYNTPVIKWFDKPNGKTPHSKSPLK